MGEIAENPGAGTGNAGDRPNARPDMISALIIAKDEAASIGPCLLSLRGLAGETIVVVDDSTADGTASIASSHGARVFVRAWQGYSGAKWYGLEQASGEWVLWIDADEQMTPELADEIRRAIQDTGITAWTMPRLAFFLGRPIRHCGWYPGHVTRLFRRGRAQFDDKDIHEGLVVDGPVRRLRHHLLHYTDPSLEQYLAKLNRYTGLAAAAMGGAGRRFRLSQVLIKPPVFFFKMYALKLGFLDGAEGFILSLFSAYYVFIKYLKLWESGLERVEP